MVAAIAAALATVLLNSASAATALRLAPRFEYSDREDGISCRFFDVALNVPWPKGGPEWLDADGKVNGPRPFVRHRIEAGDDRRVQRINVFGLVKAWWESGFENDGLLVQLAAGGHIFFHSREAIDASVRPQLRLQFADGRSRFLEPAADASLDCTTYKGRGHEPRLTLLSRAALAIRFDFTAIRAAQTSPPVAAELILIRTADSPQQLSELVVQGLHVPMRTTVEGPGDGLARQYPGDRGIAKHPDVLYADGFDDGSLDRRWKRGIDVPYKIVASDPEHGFAPLSGSALRVTIARGGSVGLDLHYRFADHGGSEPEAMYFRYYLRLAPTWANADDGGKLPGFAGTYGKAGWGGRAWDGTKGWSMRGHFGPPAPVGHPAAGHTMLGTYGYDSRTRGYGEARPWADGNLAGLVPANRWVCIEQYLQLNTPGREDGAFKVWIDGRMAFSEEGLRLRDLPSIRIEEIWLNVFHGGTRTAPANMHAYIDNVVIARHYIGPMIDR